MKHETAWGDRAGSPSSCQLEVAVMAVSLDIRSALRSDRPNRPQLNRLRCRRTDARKTTAISRQDCNGKCQVNRGQRPRGDDLSLLQEFALGECRACWNRDLEKAS